MTTARRAATPRGPFDRFPARFGWIFAGALLALLAAWIQSVLPLTAIGGASADDALYVRLAESAARGEWLGPYDESTLSKGPFFPLFVAAAFRAGAPLFDAERALYVAACALFVLAVAPVVRTEWGRLLLFSLLVLNPVVVTRAVREGLYPALTLLVLAGGVGVLCWLPTSYRRAAAWAGLCGVSLGALWLTREEGIWIVPAVALLLGAAVLRAATDSAARHRLLRATVLALLPLPIAAVCVQAVALRNRAAYGVPTACESTDRPFTSAYGALARIVPSDRKAKVPVPADVRRKAYGQSEAFRHLEPFLEGAVGAGWSAISAANLPETAGEIAGGWFQFAIREAAAKAGFYRDATTAASFWRRVASELNGACAAGRLDCLPERHTLTPVGALALAPTLLRGVPENFALLCSSIDASSSRNLGSSSGPPGARLLFARVTREPLAPGAEDRRWVTIRGWAYRSGAPPLEWRARAPDGTPLPVAQSWSPSGDLVEWFSDPSASRARFRLEASCPGPCAVELTEAGSVLLRFEPSAPDERSGPMPADLKLWLDTVKVRPPERAGDRWGLDDLRRGALDRLASAYARGLGLLLPAAVVLFGATAAWALIRRRAPVPVLVGAALLGAVVSRIVLLDLVDRTSFPALHPLYFAPAYPLLYAFVVLAFVSAAGALGRVPAAERLSAYLWTKATTFGFTRRSKSE
ncbi:MAG: hypothetical protein IPL90_10460 [Holophagales bacterium]|nr:hypothetical protein [Holophagales bacterium]